ncbi:MAG: hypothetical protein IPK72_24710 [Candidatus Eisenbacteria bacterium]|nr:hypothetical protein [Candidatus Eisenbacteria bacterium]
MSLRDARALALIGLQRAGEAEKLLRSTLNVLEDRKAKGEDSGEGEGLANLVRVHLGMALAGQHRWPEAESLLVTCVPQLPQREAETRRAIRFVVDFYDAWNRAEPDPTRAARAEEWRRRPESAQAASASR